MKKLLIALVVTAAACGGAKDDAPMADTAMAPSGDVALALKVSSGVDAAPAMTDSVLAANGLTRAGLDSLMYRIGADSAMSAQYAAARQ